MGSLGRRILLATLAVAVLAAVLTGLLVREATLDATEEAAEQNLATDAAILAELRSLLIFTGGWDHAPLLVNELSALYDRRIALTALDGESLADSDLGAELPPRSSARIDPRSDDGVIDFASTIVMSDEDFLESLPSFPSDAPLEDPFEGSERCIEASGLDGETLERIFAELSPEASEESVFGFELGEFISEEIDADDPDEIVDVPSAESELLRCLDEAERQVLPNSEEALLYLGYPADELVDAGSLDPLALGVIALAVIAAAATAASLLARRISTPVRGLTVAVDRLGSGDLSARAPHPGSASGEVATLATAFNSMAGDLEEGEQTRQRMVRDVAHELRNPIGVLRGNLEAAQDGLFLVDDDMLSMLLDETVHLAALVEDLQQLALADAGTLRVNPEPTDLLELAEQVVTAQQSAARDAELTLSLAGDAAPVDADPVRLRQVILNLLSNAIAYTPAGGVVEVRVSAHAERVELSVTDSGPGLTPEEQVRVFDRFWRADESRNRHTGGAGLGLSICKQLVEAHRGSIAVRSVPGDGATFTISLPLR